MKKIIITQHEINQATRPNIQRNRKKYSRDIEKREVLKIIKDYR